MTDLNSQLSDATVQTAAYTTSAAAISNGVGDQTWRVLVVCTTDAYIAVGTSPTATTSDTPIGAWREYIIRIQPGEKVSAIHASANGNLHVTELTE